jgi:hypothetical protein
LIESIYERHTDFVAIDQSSICTPNSTCDGWYVLGKSSVFTSIVDSTLEMDIYVFSPTDFDLDKMFTVAWAL